MEGTMEIIRTVLTNNTSNQISGWNSSGHNCMTCGQWVGPGVTHVCGMQIYPTPTPTPSPHIFPFMDERVVKLLERIADALERFVDWERPDTT